MRLVTFLKQISYWQILVLGIVLIILVGSIDYLSGDEISFSIFYLIPILLVTWFGGIRTGIVFSCISSFEWILADFFGGHVYSHPAIPYWNMLVRLSIFLLVVYIMSRLKDSLRNEQVLARTDSLTAVSNARYFYELASHEILRNHRSGSPLSLAYIDLDNFKWINDTLGHQVGDDLLKQVAAILKEHVRGIDITARLGGDEFVILLPQTDLDLSLGIVSRVHAVLKDQMEAHAWPVTFSIGLVSWTAVPDTVDEMVTMADNLMYQAKNSGKNRIESTMVS